MFFLRSGGDMFMVVQTLLQESDKKIKENRRPVDLVNTTGPVIIHK